MTDTTHAGLHKAYIILGTHCKSTLSTLSTTAGKSRIYAVSSKINYFIFVPVVL